MEARQRHGPEGPTLTAPPPLFAPYDATQEHADPFQNGPAGGPCGSLFSSLLDPQETFVGDQVQESQIEIYPGVDTPSSLNIGADAFHPVPLASHFEISFRHSHWSDRRERIWQSLRRTHATVHRLAAFANCGGRCHVEYSHSTDRVRLKAHYCHDRLCEACGTARSAVLTSNMLKLMEGKPAKFLTLTLKHRADPLHLQIDRLVTCFRNLRANPLWKAAVAGGAYFIEVHQSASDKMWHPHLHIILQGDYLAQNWLSSTWLSITGDSDIVHIRAVENPETAARYVSKYVSKPITAKTALQPDALDEAVLALKGRRLCSTFGAWRGKDLEATPIDPKDWRYIAPLSEIFRKAKAGEPWALTLLQRLSLDHEIADPEQDTS